MNTTEAKYKLTGVHPGTDCWCTILCPHGNPISTEPGTILKVGKEGIEIACEVAATNGIITITAPRLCLSYGLITSITDIADGCRVDAGCILVDISMSADNPQWN